MDDRHGRVRAHGRGQEQRSGELDVTALEADVAFSIQLDPVRRLVRMTGSLKRDAGHGPARIAQERHDVERLAIGDVPVTAVGNEMDFLATELKHRVTSEQGEEFA
ncbi:MAG TPA: hypothetical protein VFR14_06490 [Candidatus Limnocylindrales bacterium]|nr:hypothetical protein [Candidatus Limnocylindrales bacterium]